MLYRVSLNGFLIEASSKDIAYAKARERLRQSPESVIASIGEPGAYRQQRSLLYRLITGK